MIRKITPPGYYESELSHVWFFSLFHFLLLGFTFTLLALGLERNFEILKSKYYLNQYELGNFQSNLNSDIMGGPELLWNY